MYAYQKYLFAINFFVTYCWSAGFREPATMRWCVRSSTKWESGHSSKAAPGRRLFRQFLVWEVLGQFNWGSQSRTDKERGRDRKDESECWSSIPAQAELFWTWKWEYLADGRWWGFRSSAVVKRSLWHVKALPMDCTHGSAFTAQGGSRDKGTKVSAPSLLCSCQVCFDTVLRVSCCC